MRLPRLLCLLVAFLVLGLGVLSAGAQEITGTIRGVVVDESKGAMPGTTVTTRNVDTGIERSAVTDGEGRYQVNNLPIGPYRVEAELQGFQTAVRTGIVLTIGQEIIVDFTLGVGSLTESVEVTAEAPLVDTTRSQLATLVDQRQIAELPLISRSYTDLALLTPGVMTPSRNAGVGISGTSGGGVRLAINGARPTNTGFYVDGMDTKDAFGRTPGSAAGTTLGVDTIREFQVLTSNFSAQFGGSGGVLNAVTKSGTNQIHGNAFWFLRSEKFDTESYFESPARQGNGKNPFRRDQTGFSTGGPIKRDSTFFFASYEHLRLRQTSNNRISVPSAALKSGITPSGNVVVNATSAKYLAAMPLPTGPIAADSGLGDYIFQQETSANEDYFMGKVDQQLGQKDSFFVRLTTDYANDISPRPFPGFFRPDWTRGRFIISEYNRILSPTLLNTIRFSFNRSDALLANTSEGIDPSLSFQEGAVAPQLQVSGGLTAYGNDGINDRGYYLTSVQAAERLSWTKGIHALVAGMDFLHTSLGGYSASRYHGRVTFSTVNDFLIGRPATWELLVPNTGSDPCGGWAVDMGIANEEDRNCRTMLQNQFAFYLQDDIKPRQNLTLNIGLRWEFVDGASEKDGKLANVINQTDTSPTIVDDLFKAKKSNFGPRLGVAWDPMGDGKTSIRGGYGVFYQAMNYATWQIAAFQNPPFFVRTQIPNPAWPPDPLNINPAIMPPNNPTPLEYEPSTPYYVHYNASVQRQMWGGVVVSMSYAGSKGRHLASTSDWNPFTFTVDSQGKNWGATGTQVRNNTAFGSMELRGFDLVSDYNSFQSRASKRFGSSQLSGSYTYATNLDNGSETQGTALMDRDQPRLDYGFSDNHVRHNFNLNYVIQVPFFVDRRDAVGYLLGGWQVSGLMNASSGTPSEVGLGFNRSRQGNQLSASSNNDRPNLVEGGNSNPLLDEIITNADGTFKYAEVSPFVLPPAGRLGNVGRNTLIGPGYLQFDASFVKQFPFGAARRLEFRFELFNIFNQRNLSNPNTTAFNNATGPSANFGRITGTGRPREGQMALKFIF